MKAAERIMALAIRSRHPSTRRLSSSSRIPRLLPQPMPTSSASNRTFAIWPPQQIRQGSLSVIPSRMFSTQDKPGKSSTETKSSSEAEKSAADVKQGEEDKSAEAAGEAEEKGPASKIEELEATIKKLEAEVGENKDHLLRALAEAENVRSRLGKEIDSARTYGIQKFAKQMVDVADNLKRAIESIPENERLNDSPENHHLFALCEGVEMTRKELEKVFHMNGIEEYGQEGDVFDPHIHEAMFQMPDPEKEPNTVGQVLKTGYKFKDRVLRPAQVGTVVATKPAA